jgi:hypothetical protein
MVKVQKNFFYNLLSLFFVTLIDVLMLNINIFGDLLSTWKFFYSKDAKTSFFTSELQIIFSNTSLYLKYKCFFLKKLNTFYEYWKFGFSLYNFRKNKFSLLIIIFTKYLIT